MADDGLSHIPTSSDKETAGTLPGSGASDGLSHIPKSSETSALGSSPYVFTPTATQQPTVLPSQMPPPTFDQIPGLVNTLKYIESGEWMQALKAAGQTYASLLTVPEIVADLENYAGLMAEQDPMRAAISAGVTPQVVQAIFQELPSSIYENSANAAPRQPNVSTFFAEHKNKFTASELELVNGILLSLPAPESEAVIRDATMRSAQQGNVGGIISDFVSYPFRASNQNYREQLAGEAAIMLRSQSLSTNKQKTDFIMWLYRTADEKRSEMEGRTSHLGLAGHGLDVPKEIVTAGVNSIFNQFKAPNDTLDYSHISLGQNVAMAWGHGPGDEGAGFLRGSWANPIEWAAGAADYALSPAALVITGVQAATGNTDDIRGASIFRPFVEEMRRATNYEMISGGTDFLSWQVLDPANYAAGIGFGMKAVKELPRAASLGKARLFMQAVMPFYGGRTTGVRFGITSRLTYSMFSRTADEMIDLAKHSAAGKRTYEAVRNANNVEEVMRKVDGLNGQGGLADLLMKAAKAGEEDFYWETLRGAMYGWNDADNPRAFDAIRGYIAAADDDLSRAAQKAMDDGNLGIRDIMVGATGVESDHPFTFTSGMREAVPANISPATQPHTIGNSSVLFDALHPVEDKIWVYHSTTLDTAEDMARRGLDPTRKPPGGGSGNLPGASGSATGTYVAASPHSVAGYGEFAAGGVENAAVVAIRVSKSQLEMAPEAAHLADMDAPLFRALKEPGTGALVNTPVLPGDIKIISAEDARFAASIRNETDYARFLEARLSTAASTRPSILTQSADAGDGVRKAVINVKRGWKEIEATDDELFKWLVENDHIDLAATIQSSGVGGLFELRLADLSDADLNVIRRYMDEISDSDALRVGEELLIGDRGGSKLLFGVDSAVKSSINDVLPTEMFRQAQGHAIRGLLGRKSHDMYVINRMPRAPVLTNTREAIGKWTGMNRGTKLAQFRRRVGAGLTQAAPTDINFRHAGQGGTDLRRMMRLMGVRRSTIDDVMSAWWEATTTEGRRDVWRDIAIPAIGNDINHPHLKYGLVDFDKKHGVQSYAKTADGREIGAAVDAKGVETTVPFVRALMQESAPLPNVTSLLRELKRYRFGSKHPHLTAGFGGTKERRNALVREYSSHIKSHYGEKTLENIHEDDLMSMAYADVLGFHGREDGLGLVNKMTSVGSKGYSMFHSAFTMGQLAFRPFAWAGRVNLEEHARAWMMGLPTVIRYPAQYAVAFWDAHFVRAMDKLAVKQAAAANVSASKLFREKGSMPASILLADEMMPGFSARAKKAGINLSNPSSVRPYYSHELGKALTGGREFAHLEGRGNLARRTMFRANRQSSAAKRLKEQYGILRSKDFNFLDDVPEIINKSNVWMLAEEMQSSVKDIDWVQHMRRGDIPAYAHSWGKKMAQITNDYGGRYSLTRMLEMGTGNGLTANTPEHFIRTAYWHDIADNIESIARQRGLNFIDDEAGLARFYLDTIMRDEFFGSMLKPMWGDNITDKYRILDGLVNSRRIEVTANGKNHVLDLRKSEIAESRGAMTSYFGDAFSDGNFNFPTVSAYINPLYASTGGKNPFRRYTSWMLKTFGENTSQVLHRQPAYLAERRRWSRVLKGLGWNATDIDHYAHQKAFEMVNYTFFNNQHTGAIVNRMNKVVPFFSAWAEVLGTWAWKIPSQNYLPLGYARMFHRIDNVMQGWVKLGLVEIGEDGQWHMNLSENPEMSSPLGKGISRAMHGMVTAPITVIEHTANLARLITSEFDGSDYKAVDLSSWMKDNYQLSIGSPVKINDHGIMGVNQFQFGLGPILNYTTSTVMKNMQFAGDTVLVGANTLEEVYEQLPSDISVNEFLAYNERTLLTKMDQSEYDFLMGRGNYVIDPAKVDIAGLHLQVPGTSWFDGMIEDMFYPFGHVETPAGTLREIVPSGISYMLRGLGVFVDDVPFAEGIINVITGPTEEYQITSEITKQVMHLESSEQLVTQAQTLSLKIEKLVKKTGFSTLDEFVAKITPGSPESEEYVVLRNQLDNLNDEILKRATDNAGMALFARGLMGFFAPASPRMFWDEQRVTAQWWGSREMAEAAKIRGNLDWAEIMDTVDIKNEDDLHVVLGTINEWLQDDSGNSAKAWFKEQYPSLFVWTQGTTYWGPGGAPPLVRDLDSFFDDVMTGDRVPYPPDVMVQRIARSAAQASQESLLVRRFGNNPVTQAQDILANWGEYQDMRDVYRMKLKGLDMWDAELNDGAYIKWRNRNESDRPTLYERIEEDIYEMEDALDEILALTDIVGLDPDDEKNIRGLLGSVIGQYRAALSGALDEMSNDDDFRNPREEIIAKYFLEVSAPYYEARQEQFDLLESAETKEDRSFIFEKIREIENVMYLASPTVEVEGENVPVPNEHERVWSLRSDEEKDTAIKQWIGDKPEWLSLFAANKIVELSPATAEYIPTTLEQSEIYSIATAEKNKLYEMSRANPTEITKYERSQGVAAIDQWLREQLASQGRYSEIVWLDSWPIERLVISAQLPYQLQEVAQWYLGIKQELSSMDPPKGPTSEPGRQRFLALTDYLEETYYQTYPGVRDMIDDLGLRMFDEHGRYATYHRLYGAFIGELD